MSGRHSVYVGNLPYQTTEEEVGNYFSQAGSVTNVKVSPQTSFFDLFRSIHILCTCRIVYDRETGRTKGFGFCEFSDEAGAHNAVNSLNGADFNGRQLRVNHANKN
ncbi:hypothetical protein OSTOST_14647 [Ostertagia ostertagi]